MPVSISGNLNERCFVDTQSMDWSPSPSGTVWRKRMYRVGPEEAGQVTSLVKYDQNASFSAHGHPGGEEILVLDGIFSDEHGDWPAGTYLLNPEGFQHSPFSRNGCTLLVKLRQYAGQNRKHQVLDTENMPWKATSNPGVFQKPLYSQHQFEDVMSLERWGARTSFELRTLPSGSEYFVMEGSFEDEQGQYGPGSWLRLPPGSQHTPRTENGCTLYIKTGELPKHTSSTA